MSGYLPVPESLAQLSELLQSWGVESELFGQGEAKTLQHLLQELRAGECELDGEEGELVRVLRNANLVILRPDPEGELLGRSTSRERLWLILQEQAQVFRDGRTRHRQLHASIGEKCGRDESPAQAAERALHEELGIHGVRVEGQPLQHVFRRLSSSYPGLSTEYRMYSWQLLLPEEHVREEYREEQADKFTVWRWSPLPLTLRPDWSAQAEARDE